MSKKLQKSNINDIFLVVIISVKSLRSQRFLTVEK